MIPGGERVSYVSSMTSPNEPAGLLEMAVDATPASRDRFVDFARALSIAVVVAWHTVFSLTQWRNGTVVMPNPIDSIPFGGLATWLLQIMPVFFIVGGFTSYRGVATKAPGQFLRERLQRLARPVLGFAGVIVCLEAGLRLVGGPGFLEMGHLVLVPLWFLGFYAICIAAAPITVRWHRRRPLTTIVTLAAVVAAGDLLRFAGGVPLAGYLTSAVVFIICHQIGYFYADGSLLAAGRRVWLGLTALGLVALALLTALGPYPTSMVATNASRISNMSPANLTIVALAVLQTGVLMLAREGVLRWLQRRRVWMAVVAINVYAMTIYLYHGLAYALLFAGAWEIGFRPRDPNLDWWMLRPVWAVLVLLAVGVAVRLFGRIERPALNSAQSIR